MEINTSFLVGSTTVLSCAMLEAILVIGTFLLNFYFAVLLLLWAIVCIVIVNDSQAVLAT